MRDNLEPPDQEQLEIELRDLFKNGDIRKVSANARVPYGTLTKQLNPNDPTESVVYEFLMFLFGCARTKPELEEAVWRLVLRHRPLPMDALEAASENYRAARANYEDGLATREQLEDARSRVQDVLARDGAKDRYGSETIS